MDQVVVITGASSGFGAVGDRVRTEFYRHIGLDDLLHARRALQA